MSFSYSQKFCMSDSTLRNSQKSKHSPADGMRNQNSCKKTAKFPRQRVHQTFWRKSEIFPFFGEFPFLLQKLGDGA